MPRALEAAAQLGGAALGMGAAELCSQASPVGQRGLPSGVSCLLRRLSKEEAKAMRQYVPKLELFTKPGLPAVREALREAQALVEARRAQLPTCGSRQQEGQRDDAGPSGCGASSEALGQQQHEQEEGEQLRSADSSQTKQAAEGGASGAGEQVGQQRPAALGVSHTLSCPQEAKRQRQE